MKVGDRKTFDAGTSAGCWGVEGDAVVPTTPTAGRAKLEVRAVRPGTATVHFSHRDTAVPRREFHVAVEDPARREREEAERQEAERRAAAADRPDGGVIPGTEVLVEGPGGNPAVGAPGPSPSEDARTLRHSRPGPEDDDEVAAAARRLRERRDDGGDHHDTPLESDSSN